MTARIRPATLRAAWWAMLASTAARKQLREGRDIVKIALPPAPKLDESAVNGVLGVLRRRRSTCLIQALVMQEWHAVHGRHRDVVIGVTAPSPRFRAHAWLDGDPPCESEGFSTLLRRARP